MRPGTYSQQLSWLSRNLDRRGGHRKQVLQSRLSLIVGTLTGKQPSDADSGELLSLTCDALTDAGPSEYWLALSVLTERYARGTDVLRAVRLARLDGPLAVIATAIAAPRVDLLRAGQRWAEVEVVTGEVLVDLQHTAQTTFATGIQRVARQTTQRWAADQQIILVGWSRRYDHLRRLTPAESERALHGTGGTPKPVGRSSPVLIPWKSRLVVPELGAEHARTRSVGAVAEFARGSVSAIGFDCVPITSAETIGTGMGGAFALNLAALSKADRIAAISHGAATEYQGWRQMLGGAGISGPDVRAISLPVEAPEPTAQAVDEARERFGLPGHKLVLVVGSHEPRKNHLSILAAAEHLWRQGHYLNVVFVGGNAWNSEEFSTLLAQLRGGGRPVESVSALSDDLLWAAYRLAHCTVFPSLNEGFGLPVAESLASGTPAITSGFGSMAEIASDGGAILIDPRDDDALINALRAMLTDTQLYARLRKQCAQRPLRTWDEYASEVWQYLVADLPPLSELAS